MAELVAVSVDAPDEELRQAMLALWQRVNAAGGAVGFPADAKATEVALALDAALERVASGDDLLVTLRRGSELLGFAFLVSHAGHLRRHWRTVLRVMVDPDLQGEGLGVRLMEAVHEQARRLGLEHLQLTVRGGLGLEQFYARVGYVVVGRHPGAIRVAPGDDRDEVMLVAPL